MKRKASPRRAPKSTAKLHHLLPQAYMRRFSEDGGRIHVFDRVTTKFRCCRPRNIAAETEFYTLRTNDGTKERWVEARLAEVDAAVSIFDKIERHETLTREERWRVSFFVAFAETRGAGFRKTGRAQRRVDRPPDVVFHEKFAEALHAVVGVWLPPSTIEKIAREEFAGIVSGFDEISAMADTGFELAMHLFWMKWLVGSASLGSGFITSDRPLGVLGHNGKFGDDPFQPGAIKVFPISPTAALFIADPVGDLSIEFATIDAGIVRLANTAIARRADRNILSSSEALIRSAVADAGHSRNR